MVTLTLVSFWRGMAADVRAFVGGEIFIWLSSCVVSLAFQGSSEIEVWDIGAFNKISVKVHYFS